MGNYWDIDLLKCWHDGYLKIQAQSQKDKDLHGDERIKACWEKLQWYPGWRLEVKKVRYFEIVNIIESVVERILIHYYDKGFIEK